jgi:hypothetical protein
MKLLDGRAALGTRHVHPTGLLKARGILRDKDGAVS